MRVLEALREEAVSWVGTPFGFWSTMALTALLLCVGAVSILRWLGARWRQVVAGAGRRWDRRTGQTAEPRTPRAQTAEPLRRGPGPRDW